MFMTLQPKTFNIQHPTSNIQVTDAEKPGGSALNACSRDNGVECSMFVREISRRATIRTDRSVASGILPAVAGGIPAAWHPEKRLTNCCIKPWKPHYD
jgi:hypothetical protein